jgi:hypothetical protein
MRSRLLGQGFEENSLYTRAATGDDRLDPSGQIWPHPGNSVICLPGCASAAAARASGSAFFSILFTPTSHASLERPALGLSSCPESRSPRTGRGSTTDGLFVHQLSLDCATRMGAKAGTGAGKQTEQNPCRTPVVHCEPGINHHRKHYT